MGIIGSTLKLFATTAYKDGKFVEVTAKDVLGVLQMVEVSPRGEIEIDARGETTVPGVFAAGDATTVPYKQIVIAMGRGQPPDYRRSTTSIRLPADIEGAEAQAA